MDCLSLVLALSEDRDERKEEAVQEILTDLWEKLRELQRLVQRMSHTVLSLLKKRNRRMGTYVRSRNSRRL